MDAQEPETYESGRNQAEHHDSVTQTQAPKDLFAMIPKPWGVIYRFVDDPTIRVEEIQIKKGGYSSIHCHLFQRNRFHVTRGKLLIRVFDPKSLVLAMMSNNGQIATGGRVSGQTPESLKSLSQGWSGDNLQDVLNSATVFTLRPGDNLTINNAVWHQFEAITEVSAVEIYDQDNPSGYVQGQCSGISYSRIPAMSVNAEDILRITENGVYKSE